MSGRRFIVVLLAMLTGLFGGAYFIAVGGVDGWRLPVQKVQAWVRRHDVAWIPKGRDGEAGGPAEQTTPEPEAIDVTAAETEGAGESGEPGAEAAEPVPDVAAKPAEPTPAPDTDIKLAEPPSQPAPAPKTAGAEPEPAKPRAGLDEGAGEQRIASLPDADRPEADAGVDDGESELETTKPPTAGDAASERAPDDKVEPDIGASPDSPDTGTKARSDDQASPENDKTERNTGGAEQAGSESAETKPEPGESDDDFAKEPPSEELLKRADDMAAAANREFSDWLAQNEARKNAAGNDAAREDTVRKDTDETPPQSAVAAGADKIGEPDHEAPPAAPDEAVGSTPRTPSPGEPRKPGETRVANTEAPPAGSPPSAATGTLPGKAEDRTATPTPRTTAGPEMPAPDDASKPIDDKAGQAAASGTETETETANNSGDGAADRAAPAHDQAAPVADAPENRTPAAPSSDVASATPRDDRELLGTARKETGGTAGEGSEAPARDDRAEPPAPVAPPSTAEKSGSEAPTPAPTTGMLGRLLEKARDLADKARKKVEEIGRDLKSETPKSGAATDGQVELSVADVAYNPAAGAGGRFRLTGRSAPGSRIVISIDGEPLGGVIVGDDGRWEFESDYVIADGVYELRVARIGADGQVISEVLRSFSANRSVAGTGDKATGKSRQRVADLVEKLAGNGHTTRKAAANRKSDRRVDAREPPAPSVSAGQVTPSAGQIQAPRRPSVGALGQARVQAVRRRLARLHRLDLITGRKPARRTPRHHGVRITRLGDGGEPRPHRTSRAKRRRALLRTHRRRVGRGRVARRRTGSIRRRHTRHTRGWRWHRVRKGDTLWNLAEKFLGDGAKFAAILCRNRGRITSPNRIFANQRIRVPRRGWRARRR